MGDPAGSGMAEAGVEIGVPTPGGTPMAVGGTVGTTGGAEEVALEEAGAAILDEPNLRASFRWFRSWRPAASASA